MEDDQFLVLGKMESKELGFCKGSPRSHASYEEPYTII